MDRNMLRKLKKRKKSKNPSLKPTDIDMEIAKYVRFKVPRKSTVMQKQSVEYFSGEKAVDVLMESKWATRHEDTDILFVTREDATSFLDELLQKKFFYRVMKNEKEVKSVEEDKNNDSDAINKAEKTDDNTAALPSQSNLRRRKKEKTVADGEGEDLKKSKEKSSAKSKEKKTKEKVKKRYKLTVHEEQQFFDSKDIYIWLYNPVSPKTILMGLGVLLCVVAATLFPLWPPQVRVGVYYVSLAGGVFIGSIFVIAFARSILYGIIWLVTGGKHHLWILPNILADVGFFESFKPFYTHEYRGSSKEDPEEEELSDEKKSDVTDAKEEEEKPPGSIVDATEDSEQKEPSRSECSTEVSSSESCPS